MLCRIKAADSAFPHRSTLSSVQWYVSWGDAGQAQRCTAWLKVQWPQPQVVLMTPQILSREQGAVHPIVRCYHQV